MRNANENDVKLAREAQKVLENTMYFHPTYGKVHIKIECVEDGYFADRICGAIWLGDTFVKMEDTKGNTHIVDVRDLQAIPRKVGTPKKYKGKHVKGCDPVVWLDAGVVGVSIGDVLKSKHTGAYRAQVVGKFSAPGNCWIDDGNKQYETVSGNWLVKKHTSEVPLVYTTQTQYIKDLVAHQWVEFKKEYLEVGMLVRVACRGVWTVIEIADSGYLELKKGRGDNTRYWYDNPSSIISMCVPFNMKYAPPEHLLKPMVSGIHIEQVEVPEKKIDPETKVGVGDVVEIGWSWGNTAVLVGYSDEKLIFVDLAPCSDNPGWYWTEGIDMKDKQAKVSVSELLDSYQHITNILPFEEWVKKQANK